MELSVGDNLIPKFHIYIFSLTSIKKIYEKFGFELVDAYHQITHGGSMRYILKRKKNFKKSKNLINLLNIEKKSKIDKFSACLKFKKNVHLAGDGSGNAASVCRTKWND